MDLANALGTVNHELLIGKFHANGFSKEALLIVLNYLSILREYIFG